MKFINDITHARLLKMDRITCPNEPLRFRNLVLVFCESGELDFELNYTSYTLKENGFLIITPFDILTFESYSSNYSSTVLVLPSEAFSPVLKDINLLNFKYINLYDSYIDSKGELIKELTRDGVHLHPTAYDKWAKITKKYVYE